MKVFVLVLIAMGSHGQPVVKQAGTYQTAKQCQDAFTMWGVAAAANHVEVSGVCLGYATPHKEL
jgi:hypothetical protein